MLTISQLSWHCVFIGREEHSPVRPHWIGYITFSSHFSRIPLSAHTITRAVHQPAG